jgi:hypothetical protein
MMVVAIAPLPSSLGCQMHICKLVAGKVPSFEKPSSESLGFVAEFEMATGQQDGSPGPSGSACIKSH